MYNATMCIEILLVNIKKIYWPLFRVDFALSRILFEMKKLEDQKHGFKIILAYLNNQ